MKWKELKMLLGLATIWSSRRNFSKSLGTAWNHGRRTRIITSLRPPMCKSDMPFILTVNGWMPALGKYPCPGAFQLRAVFEKLQVVKWSKRMTAWSQMFSFGIANFNFEGNSILCAIQDYSCRLSGKSPQMRRLSVINS